jgi:2-keto-4-pentenoate hydratase
MSAAWDDPRVVRGMAAELGHWRRRLAAGEGPLGWKVGFGAPAAMEKLSIKAPLVGFLTDRALLPSGAVVSLSGWTKPAAEAEIAVHIGRDLPGGASRAETREAIASLGPAIEIADVDFPPDDVERILAGNIYQRHVILGPCDASRAGCVLDGLTCRIVRGGSEYAKTTDPQALTGELVGIVRHVADLLAACGERLRAGQVIITGSITPPLWVEPGEALTFSLDPVGSVSVRFA